MNQSLTNYKYFIFFAMLYLCISLCSLVCAQKMCMVFGYSVMAGSLIYPLTFTISDILTEIYGYNKTKSIVLFSFVFQILFALICLAIVNLKSPSIYQHAADYTVVLGNLLRIAVGSLVASIVGTILNIYLISKSKILLKGKLFSLRSLFSSLIGEFIYTFIAIVVMSYGKVSSHKLLDLVIASMIVKIIYNLITIIPATITVMYLKTTLKKNGDISYFENNLIPPLVEAK